MEFISDEALDDEERQMGADTVAALMWYYGLTHPAMLALIFVGGTMGRRAKKIQAKVQRRRSKGSMSAPPPAAPPPAPSTVTVEAVTA